MIKPIYYGELGRAQHGWLDARHHFSFGNYYNPKRMSFGTLRVINDDIIAAGTGFGIHPHANMEIITYVRQGAITHKDSNGNEGRTEAGDVQVMSAGTGIKHSEHNSESIDTNLYQIWIEPNQKNVKPRWDSHQFPKKSDNNRLNLLVSGDQSAPLFIHADARIYAGKIKAQTTTTQSLDGASYLLVSDGEIELSGTDFKNTRLRKGDAAEITRENEILITAAADSEVLVIELTG